MLFSLIFARRPILPISWPRRQEGFFDQMQACVHALNEEELKEYLMKGYREYKEYGVVWYSSIDAEVVKYTHREMARKFADVLDRLA